MNAGKTFKVNQIYFFPDQTSYSRIGYLTQILCNFFLTAGGVVAEWEIAMGFLRPLFQGNLREEMKYSVIHCLRSLKVLSKTSRYAKGMTSANKFLRSLEKRTLWRTLNSPRVAQSSPGYLLPCPWGLPSGFSPRTWFCLSFPPVLLHHLSICLLRPAHLLGFSSGVTFSRIPSMTPPLSPQWEQLFPGNSQCFLKEFPWPCLHSFPTFQHLME